MNELSYTATNSEPTNLSKTPNLSLLQVGCSSIEPVCLLASSDENEKQSQYLMPFLPVERQQNLHLNLYNGDDRKLVKCLSEQQLREVTSMPKHNSTHNGNKINNPAEQPTVRKRTTKLQKNTEIKTEEISHAVETIEVQNYVHIPDRVVAPRAVAVLPAALQLRRDCVSARRKLPPRVRFGPVEGIATKIFKAEADEILFDSTVSRTPVFLCMRDEDSVMCIDVTDKDKANWMSLLPLGDENTANVWIYEDDNKLYGVTTESIKSRIPLKLGYSKKYADEHEIPQGFPVLDLSEALSGDPKWWCFECRYSVGSAALFQRHINAYHNVGMRPTRTYRCTHCARIFSRLFSLKRHMTGFCTKITEELNIETEKAMPVKEEALCNAQNIDDSRTPSDESFQNYTTGLDFSTSLFDADRILKLDISGSSRSETDFNPYKLENSENNSELNEIIPKKEVEPTVSCSFCDVFLPKSKKRRHLRDCVARGRRFSCGCGAIFTKKEKLAQHIYSVHVKNNSTDSSISIKQEPTEQSEESIKDTPYKCDDCKVKFKRRGMLVNHLWRVHNKGPASVPLERRVKHYPCATCPNMYSTAAKRDGHVRKHHPEAKAIRAAPIVGESRRCEPAACAACPRQYTTRAKLLQHLRERHPHLTVPKKSKLPVKTPQENQQAQPSSLKIRQCL